MRIINTYFILKILIPIIVIILLILYIIINNIKFQLNRKLKQDCYKCKNYELFDVISCGDGCRYKCKIKNRYDYHGMNDKYNFVKCKQFKDKK